MKMSTFKKSTLLSFRVRFLGKLVVIWVDGSFEPQLESNTNILFPVAGSGDVSGCSSVSYSFLCVQKYIFICKLKGIWKNFHTFHMIVGFKYTSQTHSRPSDCRLNCTR